MSHQQSQALSPWTLAGFLYVSTIGIIGHVSVVCSCDLLGVGLLPSMSSTLSHYIEDTEYGGRMHENYGFP